MTCARAWLIAELTDANHRSQSMVHLAVGGGLVTVATVCLKFAILGAHLDPIIEGLLAGINYAACFLLMHFLHFTLATKQPPMIAPTIARELDRADTPEGVEHYVYFVLALIRTQAAAILGNVVAVAPVCLAVQWLSAHLFGAGIVSLETAHKTIESFSVLVVTPLWAALTGVLLWESSLTAGWADNWFVLHRVGDVLTYHRRLRLTFGAACFAAFFRKNLSGIVGNVMCGIMMGMVPALVLQLTPFFFEIRHITLSSGFLAVAGGVLGTQVLHASVLASCARHHGDGYPQRRRELLARPYACHAFARTAPRDGETIAAVLPGQTRRLNAARHVVTRRHRGTRPSQFRRCLARGG